MINQRPPLENDLDLANTISTLESQHQQNNEQNKQLTPEACYIKRDLANAYFQMGNSLASRKRFTEAMRFYYKAYDLTRHRKAEYLIFSKDTQEQASNISDSIARPSGAENDAEKLFFIGLQYLSGLGFPKSQGNATRYLNAAADLGYSSARSILGNLYYFKDILASAARDRYDTNAKQQFLLGMEQNDPKAITGLACMYRDGRGLPKGSYALKEASKLFMKAAEMGDPHAQDALANMYRYGQIENHPKNSDDANKKAIELYQLAAAQGYAKAQSHLAFITYQGLIKDYPKNGETTLAKAEELYRLAAEQGEPSSQYNLAKLLCKRAGKDSAPSEEALKWYCLAAEQDYSEAQEELTRIYNEGKLASYLQGTANAEYAALYLVAARNENTNAQYHLASLYGKGLIKNVPKGETANMEAVRYFRLASRKMFAPLGLTSFNVRVMRKIPLCLLKQTINLSCPSIVESYLYMKRMNGAAEMNENSLSLDKRAFKILEKNTSTDGRLSLLPDNSTSFINFMNHLIGVARADKQYRTKYLALIRECVEARIARPSRTRHGPIGFKSTDPGPYQLLVTALDSLGTNSHHGPNRRPLTNYASSTFAQLHRYNRLNDAGSFYTNGIN